MSINYSILQNIYTYTEKTVEYSYTISVLLESSGAELWLLENGRYSCCTLDIRAILYEPSSYDSYDEYEGNSKEFVVAHPYTHFYTDIP